MIAGHMLRITIVISALVEDHHCYLRHHPDKLLHGGVPAGMPVVHRSVPLLVSERGLRNVNETVNITLTEGRVVKM